MLARCFTIRLGLLCAVIDYLRATREARSDAALAHLDLDELVERISNDVVLVKTEGDPEAFLRESVSSMVWGLFQETPREDLAYNAPPAEINGDRATVRVTMVNAEGRERIRDVHLRHTDSGWRVSGRSLDDIVRYVITRLEERF